MSIPKTTQAWQTTSSGSFDALTFNKQFELPEVGDHDVLVKFHAASRKSIFWRNTSSSGLAYQSTDPRRGNIKGMGVYSSRNTQITPCDVVNYRDLIIPLVCCTHPGHLKECLSNLTTPNSGAIPICAEGRSCPRFRRRRRSHPRRIESESLCTR